MTLSSSPLRTSESLGQSVFRKGVHDILFLAFSDFCQPCTIRKALPDLLSLPQEALKMTWGRPRRVPTGL
eukprot:482282-Pyramimonas_sp.AAC.1